MEEELRIKSEEGRKAFSSGDFKAALVAWNEALLADPENTEIYCNRSATHWYLKQFEAAVSDALTSIRLAPSFHPGYVRYGRALLSLGNVEKARKAFQDALALCPQDEEAAAAVRTIEAVSQKQQGPLMQGPLSKRTRYGVYHKRWFELHSVGLMYWETQKKNKTPRVISLEGGVAGKLLTDPSKFMVKDAKGDLYQFSATTPLVADKWVAGITGLLTRKPTTPALRSSVSASASPVSATRHSYSGPPASPSPAMGPRAASVSCASSQASPFTPVRSLNPSPESSPVASWSSLSPTSPPSSAPASPILTSKGLEQEQPAQQLSPTAATAMDQASLEYAYYAASWSAYMAAYAQAQAAAVAAAAGGASAAASDSAPESSARHSVSAAYYLSTTPGGASSSESPLPGTPSGSPSLQGLPLQGFPAPPPAGRDAPAPPPPLSLSPPVSPPRPPLSELPPPPALLDESDKELPVLEESFDSNRQDVARPVFSFDPAIAKRNVSEVSGRQIRRSPALNNLKNFKQAEDDSLSSFNNPLCFNSPVRELDLHSESSVQIE